MPPNLQSEVQIPPPPTHPVAMSGSSSRMRKSPHHGSRAGHRRRQPLAWGFSCHRSNSAQGPPPFCPSRQYPKLHGPGLRAGRLGTPCLVQTEMWGQQLAQLAQVVRVANASAGSTFVRSVRHSVKCARAACAAKLQCSSEQRGAPGLVKSKAVAAPAVQAISKGSWRPSPGTQLGCT